MGLNEIFTKSLKEFKLNFKLSLKIILLFIIPLIILMILIGIFFSPYIDSLTKFGLDNGGLNNPPHNFINNNHNFQSITGNVIQNSNFLKNPNFYFIVGFLILIGLILYCFYDLIILFIAIKNEKGNLNLKDVLTGSMNYFWKFFSLEILLLLISILIFSPVIILGIILYFKHMTNLYSALKFIFIMFLLFVPLLIFYIYLFNKFAFSKYILIKENKTVFDSIKRSITLIKGRWWKIFFYIFLIILLVAVLGAIFNEILRIMTIPFYMINFELWFFILISSIYISLKISYKTLLLLFQNLYIKNLYLENSSPLIKKI